MLDNIDATKVECVTDQLKDNVATWGEDQGEEDIIIFSSFSFISFVSSPPRESQELLICLLQQPECSFAIKCLCLWLLQVQVHVHFLWAVQDNAIGRDVSWLKLLEFCYLWSERQPNQ